MLVALQNLLKLLLVLWQTLKEQSVAAIPFHPIFQLVECSVPGSGGWWGLVRREQVQDMT